MLLEKYGERNSIQDEHRFLKLVFNVIIYYAIVCYGMACEVWYALICLCYDNSIVCYKTSMLCYAMDYVVRDKHITTVVF